MEQERKFPAWGATALLPEKWTIAWGARAIADRVVRVEDYTGKTPTHVASLLGDRQGAAGNLDMWDELNDFLGNHVLPIRCNYDGSSREVTKVDQGEFHARWTPNGSYGYIYIIAWKD